MSAKRRTVVVASEDAGGASAIAPVIEHLLKRGEFSVKTYCRGPSTKVFYKAEIPFVEVIAGGGRAEALRFLEAERDPILLTSTSMDAEALEKGFIGAAHQLGIPSISVIDYWCNYRERFAEFPTWITVPDELARDQAVAEKIDSTRIKITGQPAFDRLAKARETFTKADRLALRKRLGVGATQPLVLFLSQPTAMICKLRYGSEDFIGYTEKTVLPLVLEAIGAKRGAPDLLRPFLAVRPHPSEDPAWLNTAVSGFGNARICLDEDLLKLALSSDLVVGMDTVFLVEACYLGLIAVSLQPGLRGITDPVPTNQVGLSLPCFRAEDFKPILERYLYEDAARQEMFRKLERLSHKSQGTENVVQLIESIAFTGEV